MEVKITKRQMKEMIIKYYASLGCTDLSVCVYSKESKLPLMARNYEDKNNTQSCYVENTVKVYGTLSNDGVSHTFSEEVTKDELDNIVRANFDEELYEISDIEFDCGLKFSIFSASLTAPYCKGLVATMNRKKKDIGKYIVKK